MNKPSRGNDDGKKVSDDYFVKFKQFRSLGEKNQGDSDKKSVKTVADYFNGPSHAYESLAWEV